MADNSSYSKDSTGKIVEWDPFDLDTFVSDDGLSNTYSVKGSSYPIDLMGSDNQYGGNYVVFNINVHQDTQFDKGAYSTGNGVNGGTAGRGGSNLAAEQEEGGNLRTTAFTAAATTAGASVTSILTSQLGNYKRAGRAKPNWLKWAGRLIGVGTGITAIAVVNNLGGFKKEYKTLTEAIALYMPGDLSIKYGMQYEDPSLAVASALGKPRQSLSFLTGAALDVGGPGNVGAGMSRLSGIAQNPKKEQVFKQVDFRTFTFNYQFFPRSKDEAKNILAIIKLFKFHMHPEFMKDTGKFLYVYPSEFDITYYHNGKRNPNIHKHTSCVLTDLQLNYTPQQIFTAFEDGMPTQINMQLTFKELATLSKETIAKGF